MFEWRVRRAARILVAGAALAAVTPSVASADRDGGDRGDHGSRGDIVCPADSGAGFGVVTGYVKHDVIVPPNQTCDINHAWVGHDVLMQHDSYVGIASSYIAHDVSGTQVSTLETGNIDPGSGPVYIGHDLTLTGQQNNTNFPNGYTVCSTTIEHNLEITNTKTPFGTVIGDTGTGPEEFCTGPPNVAHPQDRIGHDVIITNNVFGRLDIGDNTIDHDLTVGNNTATTAFGDLGTIDVSDNKVGHDARCFANNPPPSPDGAEDGPNQAGHANTCP